MTSSIRSTCPAICSAWVDYVCSAVSVYTPRVIRHQCSGRVRCEDSFACAMYRHKASPFSSVMFTTSTRDIRHSTLDIGHSCLCYSLHVKDQEEQFEATGALYNPTKPERTAVPIPREVLARTREGHAKPLRSQGLKRLHATRALASNLR